MKASIVYESLFGNTARIGEAIAASLRAHGIEVTNGPISEVAASGLEADLIVVGAPTHAHGMSRTGTRQAAIQDNRNSFPGSADMPGIRDWLGGLPADSGRFAAAFDTRFDKPRFFTGSAAKGIARRLEQHGYRLVAPPESFFVTGQHELESGETEHAAAWGTDLADRASAGAPH
jgi:flavodoxin